MNKRLVAFGEVMIRFEPPGFGRLVQALPGEMRTIFAGAEANVASAISLLGGDAEFVTALPDNQVAEALVRKLRADGVRTSRIVRVPGSRLGIFYSERGANQRPSVVVYDRAHSAVAEAPGDVYDWDAAFDGADWFHVTGITPAISESAANATRLAAERATKAGLTVSCDLNYRGTLWRWDGADDPRALARATMPAVLEHATLVIGNEADAHDVLGIAPPDSDVEQGRISREGYVEVARSVARRFPKVRHVAFTLRESVSASHNRWGTMLYSVADDAALFAPECDGTYTPYEITDIVDRVGAGDAFAASLIQMLREGSEPRRALEFATGFSCLAHSIEGDVNYSTRADVEKLLASGGSGRVQR
ncbi:MAG: PfkB family carbohydrate kinase [Spirochaetota bacterium]